MIRNPKANFPRIATELRDLIVDGAPRGDRLDRALYAATDHDYASGYESIEFRRGTPTAP